MSAPVRVLQIIDTGGPGGAEAVYRSIVLGLEDSAWDPVAVLPNREWLHQSLVEAGVKPRMLRFAGASGPAVVRGIRRLLRETGAGLVHAHMFRPGVLAGLATLGTRVPVVTTVHGLPDLPPEGPIGVAKMAIISSGKNRLTFVSATLQRSVTSRYRIPSSANSVVYNGIPDQATASPPARPAEHASGLRVLAVGNVRPAKDYPLLLRATRIAVDRGVPLTVRVAGEGDGALLHSLIALRTELQLDRRVEFLGFRGDIPALLDSSDLFLLTSLTEGFSLATVEAMQRAVPVIATRSGGPEEIVRDGQTGVLVPPGDPSAVADAIEWMYRNQDLARLMAMAGQRDVLGRFSLRQMLDGYAATYRAALSDAREA